ncbi:hypothetical protein NHX12_009279, partial [Muraenolepis orangiensis]
MASEELARKLQRRLNAEQEATTAPSPTPAPEPTGEGEMPAKSSETPETDGRAGGAGGAEASDEPAPSELTAKLSRRLDINDGTAAPRRSKVFNPYTEFKEFSRKQIKEMEAMFKRFDHGKDGFIDLMELKLMMEKLGAPQTHLGLKNMIKEVDEDFDGKLSYREFLLIFHKAAAGELEEESGLMALARLSEIDVSTEGVMGAKDFFEAKMQALSVG